MEMKHESDYARLSAATRIDAADIDTELLQLAPTQQEVTEFTAYYSYEKELADAALKQTIAETAHILRQDVLSNNGKQRSEAQIASEILLDRAVQKATRKAQIAKLHYDQWKGLADSFRTKTEATKALGSLIIAGYLTPSAIRRSEFSKARTTRGDAA